MAMQVLYTVICSTEPPLLLKEVRDGGLKFSRMGAFHIYAGRPVAILLARDVTAE